MKKLFFKSIIYSVLILISLEVIVRVFHLSKDNPSRYVDEFNVEKWVPNQEGYSVTGNRKQNFSKYYINSSGYNSYREFNPSADKIELALVGDSFIEGFHQNYYNSIGKKIENRIDNIEVYEYGYAGYDLADQLHLIHAYKEEFDKIDYVILGLKFENDLTRSEYNVIEERMHLESPFYKKIRNIKLLVYCQNIGIFTSVFKFIGKLSFFWKTPPKTIQKIESKKDIELKQMSNINNFESLINRYEFDKSKFYFLLDLEVTPVIFIEYLNTNGFKYIDYSKAFKSSKLPTTLIYDKHWNNNGRELIAETIVNQLKIVNIQPSVH